jgi:hypothetical protein
MNLGQEGILNVIAAQDLNLSLWLAASKCPRLQAHRQHHVI